MKQSAYHFVKKALVSSLMVAFTIAFLMFLLLDKLSDKSKLTNLMVVLLILIGVFSFMVFFNINIPHVHIKKRQREIDKEVLFAGRYLLVKMQSGVPFFNALIDASKSYGVAGKYFKEIVHDIEIGTPIEKALERAVVFSASDKFKKIMWQVTNALKSGIDTTASLKAVLEEIMKEQVEEIRRYGKKLNSLAMFYMLIAVVLPSLGMAMFIVLSSFISIELKGTHLSIIVFLLTFLQFMFLSIFKSIRPNVNI